MKWKNRGHEFDGVYKSICETEAFYLFGAGDYGKQFKSAFQDEVRLLGYVDSDERKQGKEIEGLRCYSLDQICLDGHKGIIVTMSQMARSGAIKQLEEKGYKKNEDFFIIEEFISIYYVYRYDRVYLSSISFVPSTACNLRCRYCLNFNPFAKKFYVRQWDDLTGDVDTFFKCVDHIMLFHVSGGEPMLYEHTGDLIEYIDQKYGDRIDTLRLVTNGTVVPPLKVLEKLKGCKVEITVDDYRDAVPRHRETFEEVVRKLDKYGIRYYVNKADYWINLAPEKTDLSGLTEKELIEHRTKCDQSWQELRGGKLYNCNYAAYATVAGIAGEQDLEEVFDLKTFSGERKKELVEFRLGYTEKGYTNFCKKCRGFTVENSEKVMPAVQVSRITGNGR